MESDPIYLVVGLGAVGSATAYQLAKRGARVLGLDRDAPPHAAGSHCGETRITRLAIGEGDVYVPLARRSHLLWREIEGETGETLLGQVGGLWISSGRRQAEIHVSDFFAKTVAAANRFGIEHEVLDAPAIRRRFPAFNIRDDEQGYLEPTAGYLQPEACVRANLALAAKHGAELRMGETVLSLAQDGADVRVTTDRGEHRARRVVVCAGAGATGLFPPELASRLTVSRQVQYWYECDGLDDIPVWIWELQDRANAIYGFPARDGVVKVAAESFTRTIGPEEMYASLVAPYLRGVRPRCTRRVECLYTCTPDFHFLIDRHPSINGVILASPCSGHGFKHSAALGDLLAGWLHEWGPTPAGLAAFSAARFAN